MRRTLLAVAAIASLVAATVAYGAVQRATASAVAVTAGKPSELRFTLSKKIVPKGLVIFRVTNRGTLTHDFRIAGKKTALLTKGKSATLRVTFKKAGRFPYLCTVPGHAPAGMKGTFIVR